MGTRFVHDGAPSSASPYETWDTAATTLLIAVDAAIAGEDIHMAADHAETPGSQTYTFPGTDAAPNRVISVTVDTTTYNKADNIQVDESGTGGSDMTITGHVKFRGISFKIDDNYIMQQKADEILFDDCILEISGSTSNAMLLGAGNDPSEYRFKNTDVNWSAGGTNAEFDLSGAILIWEGGVLGQGGTDPTALFSPGAQGARVHLSGVDLSALSTAIVQVSASNIFEIELHHCLLHASVALTTGTIVSSLTTALMSGCDDTTGNKLYRMEYTDYWGTTEEDIANTRTGGANDGVTDYSWKMVSTGNATEFSEPHVSPPIVKWVDATGSTTFTINGIWSSVTDIQDDEIWVEIEYLSASADTESDLVNDGMADILATPADQTTNSEAWTEALANENKFQLNSTVTVNRVGPVIARVYLAKPSTTVFIDPLIVVS